MSVEQAQAGEGDCAAWATTKGEELAQEAAKQKVIEEARKLAMGIEGDAAVGSGILPRAVTEIVNEQEGTVAFYGEENDELAVVSSDYTL